MAPGLFHVWTHSVWTSVLYRDDIDRMSFVTELAATTADFQWRCIGFCVLTTHYHFIIETFDESLGVGMKRLNLRHAARFNGRHSLRGHVVGGRYKSKRITTQEQLLTTYRYVARNALDAGLCESPGDWPWGSYRSLIKPAESCTFVDISRVTDCFRPEETAVEQLRRFVESNW
jgi:REP-associated tyrosine transposase